MSREGRLKSSVFSQQLSNPNSIPPTPKQHTPEMASEAANVHINTSCHCGLFKHSVTLPLTSFPLKSAICHCNTCRHVTGQIFATFAVIPLPLVTEAQGFDKLVPYSTSPGIFRYFCPKCGASVLNVEAEEWEFATGVLDFVTDDGRNGHELLPGGLLNRGVLFTEDSSDGGAVPWINEGKSDGLAGRKTGGRNSQDVTDAMLVGMQEYSKQNVKQNGSNLIGRCHCGDVKLEVLAAEGKERYGAGLCACTSCRKACGFEFTAWSKTSKKQIKMSDGRSLDEGLEHMGAYKTSPEVHRHFCKKCGATVSYYREGMDTIDIACGLFDAPEGSRSEQWLEWNQDGDDLGYQEDSVDKVFAKKLAEGIRQKTKQ